MCVLRYNQSKRIKLGPIKKKKEFDWKGISTKGFDDLKKHKKGLVIPSYEYQLVK